MDEIKTISIFILWTHFDNELGLGPKTCFFIFLGALQNLIACQISNWSDNWFRFFANKIPHSWQMWWEYFSFKIWIVFYQSKLEFSDFDQKWGKTRLLLLKFLELPISIAWPIVQCASNSYNFWGLGVL